MTDDLSSYLNLEKSFNSLPKETPFMLIMRHGNRDPIPEGISGNDYLLNEQGVRNSTTLGEKYLKDKNVKVFSSPVQRCVQTGQYMLEGAGICQEVITSPILGSPGPFVYDRKLGGDYFMKRGTYQTIEDMLKGINIPGIRGYVEGSLILQDMVLNNQSEDSCSVYISHDAILAPYIYYHTGELFGCDNWPGFLDGVILYVKNSQLYMIRNGVTHAIRSG